MVRFRVGKSDWFKRMKVAAIIFSRMASSRLPGKALRHIAGEPLIKRVINRVSEVKKLSTLVVATSNSKNDDRLVEYIQSLNIEVFRGAAHDVLNRAVSCASYLGVDKFIRINGDSPQPELTSFQKLLKDAWGRSGKPIRLLGIGVRFKESEGGSEQLELGL